MARTRFALPLLIFTVLTACSPVEGEVQKEGAAPGEVIEIQAADLAGDWLGGFALNPEKETTETYLQLSFSIADDGESFSGAVIQAWQLELRPTALTDIILSENTFSFSLDNFSFSGTLIVDEIHGELTDGQQSGEFTLMRHQPLSQAQSDALIGSYSFPTGELIDILRSPGWIGYNAELLLFPMSPLRFAIGPGAGAAYPVDSFLNFDAEGNLLTIEFGSAELINGAEKMVLRKQEIRFPSAQDAELAGTLFLPGGDGPFPAIVMTHGSGRTTRDIYW